MSSRPADPALPRRGPLARLLDAFHGFFVWAAHLVAIYVATALACVLGLGAADAGARTTFLAALAFVTAGAAAWVLLHAARRYRQLRPQADQHFRMTVLLGCDALAIVAIAGQWLPLLLVPLCA